MSRAGWAWLRLVFGVAVLGVLLWRVGSGPFLAGLRTVDAPALVLGTLLAVPVTVCCAWRWTLVARGLRVPVPLAGAVAAYYRSQLLNTTLPGGVLGDVHRAVRHGRDVRKDCARIADGSIRREPWRKCRALTLRTSPHARLTGA